MRFQTAAVTAAFLEFLALATPALAAGSAPINSAPLSAGKPAGLKQAQGASHTLFWIAGLGIIATGIVLLAKNNGNNNSSTVTVTGTGQ